MKHTGKFLSLFLALILLLSVSIPAAASDFTDLSGHWAERYMEDLHARGFLSGYTDGTMRPNGAITACETLVFLSRFYHPSELEAQYIKNDYGSFVQTVVPSALSWAHEALMLCMATGIITGEELAAMDLSESIEKQQLSVVIIRAMQQERNALALTGNSLTFTDTGEIKVPLGHVERLCQLGIVQGNDQNSFEPTSSVSRAVAATMVSRSLNYLEQHKIELSLPSYAGIVQKQGLLVSVSGSTFQFRGTDGMTCEYALPTAAEDVTVNGAAMTLVGTHVGCHTVLTMRGNALLKVAVTVEGSNIQWAQGVISKVVTSSGTTTLTVSGSDGSDVRFVVTEDMACTVNGKTAAVSTVARNQFVTVCYDEKDAIELWTSTGSYQLTGTVRALNYGVNITLKVQGSDTMTYCYTMSFSDLPTVTRGSVAISIDRLAVGDEVTLTVNSTEISAIAAKGSKNTVNGKLSSITTTADGTYWTLTATDGATTTYLIDSLAAAYSGGSSILVSAIQIGDSVTLTLYGTVAMEIELIGTPTVSLTKLEATVLLVDPNKKQLTVLYGDKLVYITAATSSVMDSATGKSTYFSSLKEGNLILAFGSFTSSTAFTASSIILES